MTPSRCNAAFNLALHSSKCLALVVGALLLSLACAPSAHAQGCLSSSSCVLVHAAPGCNDAKCCANVCASDPTCCSADWDSGCVVLANALCNGYCGAATNGSCYLAHPTPACDNQTCCLAVCALNPFCCDVAWDLTCSLYAGFACSGTPGVCGDSGSCFEPHPTGACSDIACCNGVCVVDMSCCDSDWDATCVMLAEQICVAACVPVIVPDARDEAEECNQRLNDPCYRTTGGTPDLLIANQQTHGRLGSAPGQPAGPDVDVYSVVIVDTDGDGLVRVELTFSSSPKAWAALLLNGACVPLGSAIRSTGSELCVDTYTDPVCLPAGTYRVVIAGGTFPAIGGSSINCIDTNQYTITVVTQENCSSPCTTANGSCFATHTESGCNDPACCESVCANDPLCCEGTWDSTCVNAAALGCLSGPPSNDLCANATVLLEGTQLFNTLLSSSELPQQIACGGSFLNDVWFVWDATAHGSTLVDTCGANFDTMIAVYRGECSALTLVACNDNSIKCGSIGSSRVSFDAACATRYYVRVGARLGNGGETILRFTAPTTICIDCPSDLSGDGIVDAADLTIALGAWGGLGGDINGDGLTDAADLTELLTAWGVCR